MLPTERLNQWLGETQPGAALNENGTATFLAADGVEIVLATDNESPIVLLFAELLPLQGLAPEEIAMVNRNSLLINAHPTLTGDGALALDPVQNRLVFNQSIPWEDLDAETLWATYDTFAANAVRLWATVHGHVDEAPDGSGEPQPEQPSTGLDEPPPPVQPWQLA
ncbi:CesT family type III secretion system chaperone [Acanthopleuribacter pedis]|uniref:Type III secretion system chaperone n=1 Tax=Acanthopleuribacter pedis TaxID=442870 RepID=A0A8J7U4G3_9BACT|nr:CesT family type III secretion system chaperone [Acanthopleuribacter pedis]MBO1321453.1 type III secretion system chaperone [Acanthopleuribacter pedis]